MTFDFEINVLRILRAIVTTLEEPSLSQGKILCAQLAYIIDQAEAFHQSATQSVSDFNTADTIEGKRNALRLFTAQRAALTDVNTARTETLNEIHTFIAALVKP